MKSSLLGVLQSRMDKCTNEQFWMTGGVVAFDVFFLTYRDKIPGAIQSSALLGAILAGGVGAVLFVLSRHLLFFKLREAQAVLLRCDPELKGYFNAEEILSEQSAAKEKAIRSRSFLIDEQKAFGSLFSLTGVLIYCPVIALGTWAAICSV